MKQWTGVAVATLALLVGAGSAEARTTIVAPDDARLPYQEWVDRSLVPTPPVTLELFEESCNPEPACTYGTTLLIDAADMLTWDYGLGEARSVFLHEIAHPFDKLVMDDGARQRFLRLLGDPRPWRADGGDSPHELFAEAYSVCALRRTIPRTHWLLDRGAGLYRHRRQHRRVCRLIRNAYWH